MTDKCEKIKYFWAEDTLIAFNTRTLQIFVFKGEIKKILPQLLPEKFTSLQKKMFFEQTSKIRKEDFRSYLEYMAYDEKYNYEECNGKTLTLSFPTVHKCNLQCKYCYANAGENYEGEKKKLDKGTLKNILDYSINKLVTDCEFLQINLVSGGEPFLNLEVIEDIDDTIESCKMGLNSRVFIASNMTLYNEKNQEIIEKINPKLAVSIDGPEDVHDKMRVYKDGTGTYKDVIENLEKIKQNDGTVKLKNVMFMSVITEENLDLVRILKHHRECGATSIQMKVVRAGKHGYGIKESNVDQYIKAYENLADFLYDEFLEKNMDIFMMLVNGNDTFGKFIKQIMLNQVSIYRCGAGKERFSVTVEGDIYPCDNFVGIPEYKMGNIYDDSELKNKDIFMGCEVNKIEKCSNCWAKYLCSGDCYFNSYARTGNINTPDSCMCEFYISLCEIVIKLLGKMKIVDNAYYEKVKRLIRIRENSNLIH